MYVYRGEKEETLWAVVTITYTKFRQQQQQQPWNGEERKRNKEEEQVTLKQRFLSNRATGRSFYRGNVIII